MNTTYQDHILPFVINDGEFIWYHDRYEIAIDFHVSDNATEK